MKRSIHFRIEELVSEELFDLVKPDMLWELFDEKLLDSIDALKEKFPNGSMTINNWLWEGDRTQSGLRTKNSKYYSPTSQHSVGKAADCVFSDYETEEVRQYIIDNPRKFPYIKGIEKDVSWLHIDVRSSDRVMLFSS